MQTDALTTTLLLIPGGRELSLPHHTDAFRAALQNAVAQKSARLIMLADTPLIPEHILQRLTPYKNVFLVESGSILTEDDVWHEAGEMLSQNYLPTIVTSGFDYQVIQMQLVDVKYEDFERLAKFM
ncbi:hypothetical protein ACLI09_04785 [Flavobacterium sp. RHBU_24]|uniref:hypothetical protein n=1 Tax=Flavobacterium sp. RHBU_24 TaxID=3391185 RepID=UPI0039855335